MIQLYAIIDHPGPPLPDGMSLGMVAGGDLAAVWAPASEGEVTADTLWRHERVVEALMDDRDLLPVRYGTRLPHEAAAAEAVEARHDQLAASLDNVRGAVELSVRVLAADGAPVTPEDDTKPASGTEYLRRRARQSEAESEAGRAVHDPLALLARAERRRPPSLPGELLRAAYLIERGAVEKFSTVVSELQARHRELRLICTGPWPPYSFAER